MKPKYVVKHALVLGVIVLMFSVGTISVINATNNDIGIKEVPFQTFNKKIEEISVLGCDCGENNAKFTEYTDFFTCTLLLLTYQFLSYIGRFFPPIFIIVESIVDIARDLDCWWV